MKKHVQGWMWVSLILFTVSGRTVGASSFAPFTEDLIKQYGLEDRDTKNLQFYVSKELVLLRTLANEESTVQGTPYAGSTTSGWKK